MLQLSKTQRAELEHLDEALGASAYNQRSPYRHWGFQPVHDELQDVPVVVSGTLPPDLEGIYIRNGTNPQFDVRHVRWQMFDGPGMLHQVHIKDGRASYSNAYVRGRRFLIERMLGREVYTSMGELVTGGRAALSKIEWLQRQFQEGALPDLRMSGTGLGTAIQYHDGRLYAFNEAGYPFRLDVRREGERVVIDGSGEHCTWGGRLPGPFSAHPAIDPDTGDMFSVATNRNDGSASITIVQVSKNQLVRSLNARQSGHPMVWLHECCITRNYIVFPDISLRIDKDRLQRDQSMFYWDPGYNMRFGIVPRNFDQDTPIRWISTDRPGAIYHLVNAWEETGPDGRERIVLFAPRFDTYPDTVPIHTPEEGPAHLSKWVLDPQAGTVLEDRVLLDWGYERSSFNTTYRGRKSRFCYLLDEQKAGYMGKGALKYDCLEEREAGYADYGAHFGGEPLFVPRKGAVAEDDGYLLDLLMEESGAQLLVVDAKTMSEVCRLQLPRRVPFGVHAVWLDSEQVASLQTA